MLCYAMPCHAIIAIARRSLESKRAQPRRGRQALAAGYYVMLYVMCYVIVCYVMLYDYVLLYSVLYVIF